MYKILITTRYNTVDGTSIHSVIAEFKTILEANIAFKRISVGAPAGNTYNIDAIKLY